MDANTVPITDPAPIYLELGARAVIVACEPNHLAVISLGVTSPEMRAERRAYFDGKFRDGLRRILRAGAI